MVARLDATPGVFILIEHRIEHTHDEPHGSQCAVPRRAQRLFKLSESVSHLGNGALLEQTHHYCFFFGTSSFVFFTKPLFSLSLEPDEDAPAEGVGGVLVARSLRARPR